MSQKSGNNTLAMLDLLSCAFGGVIVLAVVMAAVIDSRMAIETQSYLVVDAWIRPVAGVPITAEHRRGLEKLALGLRLQEPHGADTEFSPSSDSATGYLKLSLDGSPSSRLNPRLSMGSWHEPDGEVGSFFTLVADQVEEGRYEIRLFLAQASNLLDLPLEVGWRTRFPSRTTSGQHLETARWQSIDLYQHWREHTLQPDEPPLLEASFQVEP